MRYRGPAPAALTLVLALIATTQAHTEESVFQILIGSPTDSGVEEVLYLSAGVELTRVGLSSRRARASVTDSSGAVDRERVEEEAGLAATRYVLMVEYAIRDTRIQVDFTLYRARRASPIGTARLESPIDIDLDARVATAVGSIVSGAGIRTGDSSSATVEGVGFETPQAETVEPKVIIRNAPDFDPVDGFEISVSSSGLVLVGTASELFRYGAGGSLAGGYSFPVGALGCRSDAGSPWVPTSTFSSSSNRTRRSWDSSPRSP